MEKKHQAKFGRPGLLMLGCGAVAQQLLPLLLPRFRVFAVLRDPAKCAAWRAAGAIPIVADLDAPHTLRRLRGLAHTVLHLAPPPAAGALDSRSRHVCAILPAGARLVYLSTSGVYGDCGGALIDETRPTAARNARAVRRVDAEQVLRIQARARGWRLTILRVPGIYGHQRLPLARIEQGLPALLPQEDVYTNHIHEEDLARACLHALDFGRPLRLYHAVDDSDMKMGEYFDQVAAAFGLAPPPRLPRSVLPQYLSPAMLSFMGESRRLQNRRLKQELRLRLRYPTVAHGLRAALQQAPN
ncbi:NAD-dependent epimerase/dehydratase family protein [Massilia sp. W12]|uniref:NAD-dependent epimerase/dehydratase family protein n=1 Tax=Massilia sp. W12 TaxID=3126507 RepID=UPI0030D167D1